MEATSKTGEEKPKKLHPVVDKKVLETLNYESTGVGYNRLFRPEALAELPKDSVFGLRPMMIHEHAAGKAVDPHMRVLVYMRKEDRQFEPFGFLDITMSSWHVIKKCEARLNSERGEELPETA